jgi:DNA-directed RNA polymerase subunit RPC12/RpoP
LKTYSVRCCRCGRLNTDLLLEETDGLFECEECGTVNLCIPFRASEDPDGGQDISFYSLIPSAEGRCDSHVHAPGTY